MQMGRLPTKNLNLPKGMRARVQKSGAIYYYFDTGKRPRVEIPLGKDYVLAVQKWATLAQSKMPKSAIITFKMLLDKFLIDELPLKSSATQKDYLKCSKSLLKFFNDPPAPLDAIVPIYVRQYLDWRGQQSKIRANHEVRLLNFMWNLARSWGYTEKANPCAGIKYFKEAGRDIYVEDAISNIVYENADQPTKDALDLGYLTAQRPCDVIKMYETDIVDGALRVLQNKTAAKLRITIKGELKAVINRIKKRKESFKVFSLALIVDEYGKPLSQHAIYKRFCKAKEKAILQKPTLRAEIEAYQIRDLRAKAVTDIRQSAGIQQAQKLAGHASETMTQHYVRGKIGEQTDPTK